MSRSAFCIALISDKLWDNALMGDVPFELSSEFSAVSSPGKFRGMCSVDARLIRIHHIYLQGPFNIIVRHFCVRCLRAARKRVRVLVMLSILVYSHPIQRNKLQDPSRSSPLDRHQWTFVEQLRVVDGL